MSIETSDFFPAGVASVDAIWGDDCAGVLVRLIREVDLDDLLLALAIDHSTGYHDEPTRLPCYSLYDSGLQASVGWFRKRPCTDGDHSWDMAEVSREEEPAGRKAYGAFLGVFVG